MKLKALPNIITALRIVGTACLLFIVPYSSLFYVVYSVAGASDVLDGFLARKLKVTSELGAKLDSIADLLFYSVMLIRIFPVLLDTLPIGIWIAVISLIVLRLCTYIFAAVKFRRFASQHTYMNKTTGAAAFALPYFMKTSIANAYCVFGCVIAGLATVEELFIHLRMKEYNPKVKTILNKELYYGV